MVNKQRHILIVEDDADLNKAYQMIIGTAGHAVEAAYDGRQALDAIEKNPNFDIIFLDLRMPVMDGIAFLKEFQPSNHPDSTVVVFSNYDAQEEVDEAFALGAHRYVLKARAAPKELLRIISDIAHDQERG